MPDAENLVITVTEPGSRVPFSALLVDHLPDSKIFIDAIRCFPLRTHVDPTISDGDPTLFDEQQLAGWESNISVAALTRYRQLDAGITEEDVFYHVYGVLHSPAYRAAFAADLKKSLPRIPSPHRREVVRLPRGRSAGGSR